MKCRVRQRGLRFVECYMVRLINRERLINRVEVGLRGSELVREGGIW